MPFKGQTSQGVGKRESYSANGSDSVAPNSQKEPYPWSTLQTGAVIASMLLQNSKRPNATNQSDKIFVNAEIQPFQPKLASGPQKALHWHQTQAIVDCGSSFDIIDPYLAKQLELQVHPLPKLLAKYLDGSNVTIYGQTSLHLRITDHEGQVRQQLAQFVVMDSPQYPIVLGMPWLEHWNPIPHFGTKTIRFQVQNPSEYSKIALVDSEEFTSMLDSGTTQLYVCTIGTIRPCGA
jgi:hypothetical protein